MNSYWLLGYYTFFLGLIVLIGISFIIRKVPFAYKILGTSLLTMGIILFTTFLIQSGLMFSYPIFFRISSPFQYAMGPLFYFFVLFLFYPSKKWKPIYWLSFLPFLLHLIELIPLYVLPPGEKIKIIENNMVDPFEKVKLGILTYFIHGILKALFVFLYSFLAFNIIRPLISNSRHPIFVRNSLLVKWVLIEIGIKWLMVCFILISFIFHSYLPHYAQRIWEGVFFLDTVFTVVFVLVNPGLLQGVKWNESPVKSVREKSRQGNKLQVNGEPGTGDDAEFFEMNAEKSEIIKMIDEYMQIEQPFLEQDFSIGRMAAGIGEKPYKISKAIKEYYGISYSDLVNKYRFKYMKEQVKTNEKWQQFSIEAMIFQAGFGSRNAFYSAFRKSHPNVSPTEFFHLKN